MVSTIEREREPRSRFEATRELLAQRRRNLLLPVLLLVAISLVVVAGVLYWSADSLNEREVQSQRALVKSMVQIRRDNLRQLVIDYAWWDEAIVDSGVILDERWAKTGLSEYLHSVFGITGGWVVGTDDRVRLAFEHGKRVSESKAPSLPQGAGLLIESARSANSIDKVPAAGLVIYEQEVSLIAASLVSPLVDTPGADGFGDVMIFVKPLDLTFFNRAGVGGHIEDLHFIRGPAPKGYYECPVLGLDGEVLGNIIWRDHQHGHGMLWSVAPFLLVSLLAVGFLLFLAVKRVETMVSREGRLSVSLYQEKQRRSQKSDFVSMFSHELRTPLQAIGTSADMLDRFGDQMSEGERREETRTIRRAVSTLACLVDDVLVMGRSDAARERAGERGTALDLAQFCRAMWREVSLALRSKQELQLEDGIGAPVAKVDELALHTVLSNLLQNAVKYSKGEGPIKVRLAKEDGEYAIAVTDFGAGIAEGQQEQIFKPYWRAKEVENIDGTGLGLAVARSAARSLGGDLRLKCSGGSSGPDCGTCFEVRWPVCN
ncbi:ATP-binding protein [Pelagibius sp. CAU 1746]|uniref:sensor histidine kinase n=1 Tax=Pelagibius sp. CAU 1746 TaxID=3140370 RepID=UPI00325C2A22